MFYFLVERAWLKMLGQGPANFTCKGSGSHILHFASHMVSLEITQLKKKKKSSQLCCRQYVNGWAWLLSSKTLLSKTVCGQDLAHRL